MTLFLFAGKAGKGGPAAAEREIDLSRVDIRVGKIVEIGPVSCSHNFF